MVMAYLGNPRRTSTSGFYLYSLASEGLRMEARQSTLGGVCASNRHNTHSRDLNSITRREDAMSHAGQHHTINYIELATIDIARTKRFYATVFGWSFVDYGPDYASFAAAEAGVNGGFYRAESVPEPPRTAPLIVLYSQDLGATESAIVSAGGSVVVPAFQFPGGRRFHFADGAGNVLAVWSE